MTLRPLAIALIACTLAALAGCATVGDPQRSDVYNPPPVKVGSADSTQLQSSLMALADTAIARIGNEAQPARLAANPERRRAVLQMRLVLASAMFGIVTGPDPVDGLLDMLTHTTLVAESLRRAAEGKPPESAEARMWEVAKRTEADAWKLSERYLDQATRDKLRARIMAASEREGGNLATAAYMRLSDLPRSGSASIDSGDGVFDTMRAATQQADQVRLLGERSLFLLQRMPFLMRWQAEAFTNDTLERDEIAQLLKQLDALTKSADQAAKVVAAMPATISKERQAAIEQLFDSIQAERAATLEQLAAVIREERKATLEQAAEILTAQRKGTIEDVTGLVGVAETRGSTWIGYALLVGGILILLLLGGLLGMLLLYRRYAPRMERR
jgi:hypothetical protein